MPYSPMGRATSRGITNLLKLLTRKLLLLFLCISEDGCTLYLHGQSFDELKQRIDKLAGSFLFVDYGELNMLADGRNSYQITQRIAITVANKMTNRADAAEYMLASDATLRLLSRVHAWMLADAEQGNIEWLSRGELDKAEIIPFVAKELSSVGWTLMLSCISPDALGTHHLSRSFAKRMQ